jgi:hypothetical protein
MTYSEFRQSQRAAADPAPAPMVGLRHHASAVAAPAPTSAPQNASGVIDPAEPILSGEPTLNDADREKLWDIYYTSPNTTELAQRLQSMGSPPGLVQQLLSAKNRQAAEKPALDRVTDAMQQMAAIDPKILGAAEKFPNVLRALVGASHE